MLFNSIQFVVFLPLVFGIYWALPHKFRWAALLAASCFFYMYAGPKLIAVLLFTTLVSFFSAVLMEKAGSKEKKKLIVAVALVIVIGVLFVFKYLGFFCSIAGLSLSLKIIIPVGISFYTFQTAGYIIDVYRGKIKAEKHFGYYVLFVSYFPQILSGPIGRADALLPQFKEEKHFDYDTAVYGMKLMMWGFFEKTVIADNLSYRVDIVFGNLRGASGGALFLAAFFYTFCIYCDFCGYTNIARGVSKLFGIDLAENFRTPYFSSSVKEFWSRWHISLSTWLRDYVYIPLGGSRCSKLRHYFNLMVTFLVSGLWHGADWTYVIWGGAHGLAQVCEDATGLSKRKSKGFEKCLRMLLVFLFAGAAWVLFRAETIGDAAYVFAHMFDGIMSPRTFARYAILDTGFISTFDFAWHMAVYFIPLIVFDVFSLKTDVIAWTATIKPVYRHALYILLIVGICLLHSYYEVEFVYFQF